MSNDKVENYLLRLSGEAYNTDLGHVEAPEALFEYYIIVGAKEKAEAERDSLHAENDRLHNAFVDFNLDIERLKAELEHANTALAHYEIDHKKLEAERDKLQANYDDLKKTKKG